MQLSKGDRDLFYVLHPALLQYVNEQLHILPKIRTPEALKDCGMENVATVRQELWKRPQFIDEFVSGNHGSLSDEGLAIVASWKYAVQSTFYILRHLKKYTVFLSAEGSPLAYGVCSLRTPLEEMFPYPPVYTDAVLVPFKKKIIYDGIMYPRSIIFGRGYQFDMEESYREAKKSPGIIETLNSTISIQ